jgi:hypothetical protein
MLEVLILKYILKYDAKMKPFISIFYLKPPKLIKIYPLLASLRLLIYFRFWLFTAAMIEEEICNDVCNQTEGGNNNHDQKHNIDIGKKI